MRFKRLLLQFKPTATDDSVTDTWNVTYNLPDFPPGEYVMEVTVYAKALWVLPQIIASDRLLFNITETLNGNITNIQNNKTIENSLASTANTIKHIVKLKDTDLALLNATATQVVTYWFVDCIYYGPSYNYTLSMNYTEPDKEHHVEALVIGGYEPITTPAPPSTTTAPNVTTTTTAASIAAIAKNVTKRDIKNPKRGSSQIKVKVNGTLVPFDGDFPYVCVNNTIPPDPTKTYGYFASTITVKGVLFCDLFNANILLLCVFSASFKS